MLTPRLFVALAALCGTVALAGWSIDRYRFASSTIGDIATPAGKPDTTPAAISSSAETVSPDASSPTVTGSISEAALSAAKAPGVEAPVLDSPPTSPATTPVRLVSAFPSRAVTDDPLPPVRPLELTSECREADACIDAYLWSLYERTPKVDTNKLIARIKKAVKKNGKMRTIMATITNYVVGDFTWKDPVAAEKFGMPLKDYVIGGMDPGFKLKLYHALRAMDAAGFMPGITSAYRDDYRQSIATGNKAASDSSYHGGSRRGGFGRGLAADIVSLRGDTRKERLASSDLLWKWIDANEKELAIGRPYRDRDPPHVGPLDGKEYAEKRGAAKAQKAAAKTKTAKTAKTARVETKKPVVIARHDAGATKRATAEKSAKVSSLHTLAVDR